jgi:hypothetical protein
MSYSTWGSKNCAVAVVSYVRVEGTWALVVEELGGPVVVVELPLVVVELVVLLVFCAPLVDA